MVPGRTEEEIFTVGLVKWLTQRYLQPRCLQSLDELLQSTLVFFSVYIIAHTYPYSEMTSIAAQLLIVCFQTVAWAGIS
jgi:hypothetical protein